MITYLSRLSAGTAILWCYTIWYFVMVAFHFEPSATLWLNSLGLAVIVGLALVLATGPLSVERVRQQFWQVFRLVFCPFCVSSFSAMTAGKGFWLLLSPSLIQNGVAISACLLFMVLIFFSKRTAAAQVA